MTKRMLLALLLAPIAAGCGASNPTPTQTTGNAAGNGVSAAYAYSRCMRNHGVSNFPDPKVSLSPGHASVAIAVNPSETGAPDFKSADKACSRLLPAPPSQAQQEAEQLAHKQNLLAFARCLRAHGLGDFPDPDQQGHLRLPTVVAAGVDIHSQAFLVAAKACVGVTHGQITFPEIKQGVEGAGSGSQSNGGG